MIQTGNFQTGDVFADTAQIKCFDRRLFEADVRVRAAHCDALFHAGILTRAEAERIKNGLQAILKRGGYDRNYFNEQADMDIHALVETRLVQLVGDAARKINVGAARADHSATVFRLWLGGEIEKLSGAARSLQQSLIDAAEKQRSAILPDGGAPRSSQATRTRQPILWAHWCLSYFERLARDRERFDEVWRRAGVMPLGSGDGAGTNFEIDREETARNLGFEGVTANSLDAAADADFAVEFVSCCALAVSHLERLADDLILFSSGKLRRIDFPAQNGNSNDFPSKKYSALEMVRVKSARIYGRQIALSVSQRNSYESGGAGFREMEEAVFDAADTLEICLRTMANAVENLRVRQEADARAAASNDALAAELADYLLHKNVPYRTVCESVTKILGFADAGEKRLTELTLPEMQRFSAQIEADVFEALSLEQMLAGKSQIGGTAPERVAEALDAARGALEMEA